ncbi:hypothetical protein LS482_16240 [Sinomicrobium kalidii]|uniref:hypothetical protein n=1 Tax=Sinomicrobium kalidii TaxID=2900738 RepID=UPI001E312B4E|nr:hypothetical protein [Sinomicrobium kalidii]UGU15223.1 hypothetical protein LS482_16240 [Sinomicrobium kalidii]
MLLLLIPLRKPRMVAWLQSLLQPVSTLHYEWKQNRERNLYRLRHNGQVCYLRKALNDEFDPELRRIEIADGSRFRRNYIYTQAEQQPRYLGTMYLRPSSDYEDTGVDFIVLVPAGLIYDPYDMRALVDFYKLASKRYRIEEL